MAAAEAFDWFWKLCAAATPFVVLGLNLRATARTNERKSLMEGIDGKINAAVTQVSALSEKMDVGHKELEKKVDCATDACRENIEAVVSQVRAFQLDVAQRYPTKDDFREKADELREEFRHYSGYASHRPSRGGEGG